MLVICVALFLIATLYACVGQAGASGFIAVMALFGLAPGMIKPTALALNVLVSLVVTLRFVKAGHGSWSVLWPFAVTSVPAAFVGGYLSLPATTFNLVLGVLLVIASWPFLFRRKGPEPETVPPPPPLAMAAGAAIGLLSGLTGMGGGVLLAPVLIHCGWCGTRAAAGVSSGFILLNSVVALAGYWSAGHALPAQLPLYAVAAVLGGAFGAQLGARHLSVPAIHRLLGVVLLVAGIRLVFT